MSVPLTVLSEDEQLFRDSCRSFAEARIKPLVRKMDEEAKLEHSVIPELFDLGLMGIHIPDEMGGGAGSFFMSVLAVEEISRVDASFGVFIDVQNTLVNNAVMRWASDEQKRRYLPRLAKDMVGAYALSEAGSGSDAFALASRAVDKGDHFLLNGRKLWITNAIEAQLFIVFANVNPDQGYKGITAFLVERDFPGFQVGKKEDKLGIRASSTCELVLEGCRVPKANVLGEVGKGYKIAIETLNEGRIGIGAQMVGVAQGSFEHGLRYAQERRQFGRPIAEFQAVQSLPTTELLDRFASVDPTPGGGSAAALAGATAAALVTMVCRMPKTRTGDTRERGRLDEALAQATQAGRRLRELVEEDSAAYDAVVAAYRLPKATDEEKAARRRAVDAAVSVATEVPLRTAEACLLVLAAAEAAAGNGNPNAASDARTAAALAWAGLRGAAENVRINLGSVGPSPAREKIEGLQLEAAQRL